MRRSHIDSGGLEERVVAETAATAPHQRVTKSDDDGAARSSAFTLVGPIPSPAKATMRPTRSVFPPDERVWFRQAVASRL